MSREAQARARTARNLKAILSGKRTTDWAAAMPNQTSLSLELTYGTLRRYFSLAAQIDALLERPLRRKDTDLYGLLLAGAYQIQHTRVPVHAALFETVAATRLLGKAWAKGLVNAVLRKVPEAPPQEATEHPAWLQQRLETEYGEHAGALMRANNARAPLCLRINTRKITAPAYRRQLDDAGIAYHDTWLDAALVLQAPQPAATLPGFEDGWVAVQDTASLLAVEPLLQGAAPGQRLLDACSAPGGKLFRLLEANPNLDITAIDHAPRRIEALHDIARRLGHQGYDCREADAAALDWWDGTPFDRVLLDVPCSGTGTLRRHPEIKVLRQPEDIAASAALQGVMLANLWRTVRRGGRLLYCTCSILAEENDHVVGNFLGNARDAQPRPVTLPTGRATRFGWQLLPLEPATDGLYVAMIGKRS